jgi:hypothetical protein
LDRRTGYVKVGCSPWSRMLGCCHVGGRVGY